VRRYWTVVAVLLVGFTGLFVLVEALGVPLLTDPTPWLEDYALSAAVGGVALLVADVVLPVPSSLVMIAHGAVFGPVVGTLLSLLGNLGAALFGFGLGRRGGRLLDRLVPPEQRRRADALLTRWGVLAVVVTRPLPLLAETTVILAGASPLGWSRTTVAAVVGSAPAALLYGLAGSVAAGFASPVAVFALVLLLAGGTWWLGSLAARRDERTTTEGVA
jgi:uncharacterized membrane protein YdjX (TVP38/TMEM64 family)